MYSIIEGWLSPSTRVVSPNFNDRPDPTDISLLIIHSISLPPGQYGEGYVDRLFTNTLNPADHPYFETIAGMTVSSHVFIGRDGAVTQYVPFDKRAWHAGKSVFGGRENCNDFSIGIELEGTDTDIFTDAQYESLQAITRVIQERYPTITPNRIAAHSEIAPGRKTDPGAGFDWARYLGNR